MKRIIGAFMVFLLGIGTSLIISSQVLQEAEISTNLSERSQKFLADKQAGGVLGKRYLDKGEKLPTNSRVGVDDCFSLVIPFELKVDRRDGECDYNYQIQSPRGNIVAYMRHEASTDWSSVPGVSMRHASGTYDQKAVTTGGKAFLTFKSKEGGKYERNAFYRTESYFIVINLLANTSENLDGVFEKILQSVEIHR